MNYSLKSLANRLAGGLALGAVIFACKAASVHAASSPNPVYAGVAYGTNQPVLNADGSQAVDANGAPLFASRAVEISNQGGRAWQENTLAIYPAFDPQSGQIAGFRAYGKAISHKPAGDVFISYTLDESLQPTLPYAFTGEYTVTGGTGSYAGATGQGVMWGLDFGGGSFRNHFQGTLVLSSPVKSPKP